MQQKYYTQAQVLCGSEDNLCYLHEFGMFLLLEDLRAHG